jgi:hypothetical protein
MMQARSLRPVHPRAAAVGRPSLALSAVYTQPKLPGTARLLLFLSAFWLLSMVFTSAAQASTLYIPVDGRQPCNLSETEQGLAALLVSHPDQARNPIICDPILTRVARERAADMANRGYFDHINPDGRGPNYLVKQAGYNLPEMYGNDPQANMIESIAMGYELTTGQKAWEVTWKDSPVHRSHLLGLDPFYAGQQHYGIGHYLAVKDGHPTNYWVFISAHPPEP